MGLFENGPYTNFHNLNLDWILNTIKKMQNDFETFISQNSIKYANPIQWDITRQYEKNTVVVDANGDGYLSIEPVPYGISIDRTEYWTKIGNFSALWGSVKNSITIEDDGNSTTTSKNRNVGDLVWVGGELLEITVSINAGTAYVVGTNCRIYSMQILLTELENAIINEATIRQTSFNSLQTDLSAEITNRINGDDTLQTALGTEITNRVNGDNALQTALSTETTNRVNGDNTLTDLVDDLQTNLDSEITNRTNADNDINNAYTPAKNIVSKFELGTPSTPEYNYTPNNGSCVKFIDGDESNPSLKGTTPSVYIQRFDQSVTADDPGHLIPALYTVFKRKVGGTGWLYSNLSYLQDDSDGVNAQSVACAGMAYATNTAKVWGLYGDAYSYSHGSTITGCEVNAHNFSGTDYNYDPVNPVENNFSTGLWCMGFGTNKNSFGVGISADLSGQWGCALYIGLYGAKDIAIDVQAKPPTVIKLHGASVDGIGGGGGGIGIDAGIGSFYGQAPNQGVLHIRDEDICFGETGLGKIRHNNSTGQLEFWWNGVKVGHLDLSGADHEM